MLAEDAIATLQVQAWPGNVRQLRNVVERILILAAGDPGQPITADMLPADAMSPAAGRRASAPSGSSPCRCAKRARCSSAST